MQYKKKKKKDETKWDKQYLCVFHPLAFFDKANKAGKFFLTAR